jgi:hypothetical protein
MIVEIRTYTVKPGMRDRFLAFFEQQAVPAQQAEGMRIVGPFIDLENPDVFIWLRAFPSLAERDRMKDAFYEGARWKDELEAIAMPMLADYTVALTSTVPFFVDGLAATS